MMVEPWVEEGLDVGSLQFPRRCRELWKDHPDSLELFFDIRRDVFLVSLERRSGECRLRC